MIIHVFLNDKLISADIIIPLLFDIKSKHKSANIKFYIPSYKGNGMEALKRNVVLYDSMCKLGEYIVYGRKSSSKFLKVFHRIWLVKFIVKILLSLVLQKSYVFHFGAIDKYPLRVFYLFNKNRTFFFSQWPFQYPENLFLVNNHYKKRKENFVVPAASKYISYVDNNTQPDKNRFIGVENTIIKCNPHKSTPWLEYLMANNSKWMNLYNLDFEPNKYITYTLRHFNSEAALTNPDSDLAYLLNETLSIIDDSFSSKTILLKPHSFTDIEHLKDILKNFKNNNYIIVELHPLLLSFISKVFVSNFFSILYNDASIFNTPVIEYTRYSEEALGITDGESIYPEYTTYFINNDRELFTKVLKDIVVSNNVSIPGDGGEYIDTSKIFDIL
jgi:hypothetical protein